MTVPATEHEVDEEVDLSAAPLEPWQVVVWNDPVNLMSYVVHVFRSYFGYPTPRAQRLMLQVHNDGNAIVATGPRETMEMHAQAMHDYGLWATVRKAPQ